ncbi:MAG TPA: type II secretion system inner membrane protein GspF [Candidatus Tectomicrobia bacterium]|nr:type II secretion system inner membrane protein GspF [Candidatus Tectomicrobia bacterium]
MPVYEYRALNASGRNIKGIVDADSSRAARLKLRRSGIYPIELHEEADAQGEKRDFDVLRFLRRIKLQEVAIMVRQLSTLLSAGLPLVESLTAVIEQVPNPALKKIGTQVRERVNEGSSLADAFAQHPRIFSPLFVNMTRAGERSGALEIVLERLADFTEKQVAFRHKISAAMVYPILMTFVGIGVLGFLLGYVIPTVTQIFEDFKQSLPLPTLILMTVSDGLRRFWWAGVVVVALMLLGIDRYSRTEGGRLVLDRIKLKAPVFGALALKIAIARFTRTLAILLKSGVPVLTSMDIVKNVVSNRVLMQVIEDARDNIREGQDIAPPLRRSQLFPPLATHMIAVGEKSGKLEDMLLRVADTFETDVETTVQGLTALIEPLMILFMGSIIGFIALSILLPIFQINQIVK